MPRGQITEQYTLPNKAVNMIIKINPAVTMAGIVMNLIIEGMNCKNKILSAHSVGINPEIYK
jgi:hypothetical protein